MKKVLLAVFLTMIAINCSGCATILGGIIGYQSGGIALLNHQIAKERLYLTHERKNRNEKRRRKTKSVKKSEKNQLISMLKMDTSKSEVLAPQDVITLRV